MGGGGGREEGGQRDPARAAERRHTGKGARRGGGAACLATVRGGRPVCAVSLRKRVASSRGSPGVGKVRGTVFLIGARTASWFGGWGVGAGPVPDSLQRAREAKQSVWQQQKVAGQGTTCVCRLD